MTARTSLVLLGLGCGLVLGCDGGDVPPVVDDAPLPDCMLSCDGRDPLAGIGPVEVVGSGYMFTEGPQWREAEGDLVFTDIPANTIYRYTPGDGPPVVLTSTSNNANGLAVDGTGALIAAEHGSRSVTRNGTPLAVMFEGKRLNSPNDVVVASDGTIYFTDPPYGIQDNQRELGFMGVFRIAPDGTLTAEHRGPAASAPNGIGLSPDGGILYVADTEDGNLYRFPLMLNGAAGPRSMLARTAGKPDGLAIDRAGNIFVATSAGIEVFSSEGQRWGVIAVPMQPSNCAFGDADHRTLYITARTAVYQVRLARAGLPNR